MGHDPARDMVLGFDWCAHGSLCVVGILFMKQVARHFSHVAPAMWWTAAAAFLGAVAYGYALVMPKDPAAVVSLALFASAVGCGAGLAAAITILPALAVRDAIRSATDAWRADVERKTRERERAAEERRNAEEQRQRDLEWERDRPERERREREREGQEQLRRQTEAAAQKRRDDARAECLLYFHLHAPDFSKRFGRAQYDEYVKAYLGDGLPPEEVERRAQRLLGLMEGHLERAGVSTKKKTLVDLARWFEETKAAIERECSDEKMRRANVARLKARYDELVQEHLQEFTP